MLVGIPATAGEIQGKSVTTHCLQACGLPSPANTPNTSSLVGPPQPHAQVKGTMTMHLETLPPSVPMQRFCFLSFFPTDSLRAGGRGLHRETQQRGEGQVRAQENPVARGSNLGAGTAQTARGGGWGSLHLGWKVRH